MFAHFLGRSSEILDERGGTHVIQTLPKNVTFTQGAKALACIRLTENGLLRWYSSCCKTPIGNTLANFKISFVGLVHNCLETPDSSLESTLGPVRARVNTKSARGTPKPDSAGVLAWLLPFAVMLAKARLNGSYKQTPFLDQDRGSSIVTPRVLDRREWEDLRKAL